MRCPDLHGSPFRTRGGNQHEAELPILVRYHLRERSASSMRLSDCNDDRPRRFCRSSRGLDPPALTSSLLKISELEGLSLRPAWIASRQGPDCVVASFQPTDSF